MVMRLAALPRLRPPPGLARAAATAATLVLGLAAAWLTGLVWFAARIPPGPPVAGSPAAERFTDAIVVLTGGSGRLNAGLELLAAGRARTLFVSGVNDGVEVRELLRHAHAAAAAAAAATTGPATGPATDNGADSLAGTLAGKLAGTLAGKLECCITLGYAADNTAGNAYETADWMRAQGLRSLRLVTANYHMQRALLEFHMAMPEAEIVSHPVASASVPLPQWWQQRRTADLIIGEYDKYLVALLRWCLEKSSGS
jgi:uncharacterized SAM-binding protein YcdF (DUF218 family)